MRQPERIFSGDYSKPMWDAINNGKKTNDFRWALYLVCCRLQELEARMEQLRAECGKKEGAS